LITVTGKGGMVWRVLHFALHPGGRDERMREVIALQ